MTATCTLTDFEASDITFTVLFKILHVPVLYQDKINVPHNISIPSYQGSYLGVLI